MKNINYFIENNIEKILNNEPTDFLLPKEFKIITSKLKKNEYKIYKPYQDSDKVILYTKNLPEITLFEIECSSNLRHQDILGALFNQGITNNCFGDIIIKNHKYYFYSLKRIESYLINNLSKIGKYNIKLNIIETNYLENYQKEYETFTIIVPSLRLDAILSSIIKMSRKEINSIIENKEVLVNYETITKKTYFLKENDIFSIHKYGKYKFNKIKTTTKKDKLVVEYIKYI